MIKSRFLLLAAIASGMAAVAHLGCIVFGASWYRFFGAGEDMAQMAEQGLLYPTLVTAFIACVLAIWSCYALSGAGLLGRLPFLRTGLCLIAAIYLVRGLAVVPMMWLIPDNSLLFWWVSSAICFAIGILYLLGVKQVWSSFGAK